MRFLARIVARLFTPDPDPLRHLCSLTERKPHNRGPYSNLDELADLVHGYLPRFQPLRQLRHESAPLWRRRVQIRKNAENIPRRTSAGRYPGEPRLDFHGERKLERNMKLERPAAISISENYLLADTRNRDLARL